MATLILTLPPHIMGGVASKAKILADHLRGKGQDVTVGVYAARGAHPELNVNTVAALFGRPPRSAEIEAFGGHRCVVVGCTGPELEHHYTEPSPLWDELIQAHDRHIAVAGTVVIAAPLVDAGVKHLVWCAGDVEGDRSARRRKMGLLRRIIDGAYVTRKLQEQEKSVLAFPDNRLLGVSPYSLAALEKVYSRPPASAAVLPIPTDMDFFRPPEVSLMRSAKPVIGFAGRLDDPRKNADLLMRAVAGIVAQGHDAELRVTGDVTAGLKALVEAHGLQGRVTFLGHLNRSQLRDFYQSLSLFMITSHQEGLAIVGIEALACGVPVVSTKCGGPEAYVRDGENGYLCDFDADQVVSHALEIVVDQARHQQFAQAARASVADRYALDGFGTNLDSEWRNLWAEPLE